MEFILKTLTLDSMIHNHMLISPFIIVASVPNNMPVHVADTKQLISK